MGNSKENGKTKNVTIGFGGISILGIVISALLGYFQYGGIDGALGCVLFFIILDVLLAIALLPFPIGCVVYWWICTSIFIPWILEITGMTWSLTLKVIWYYCLAGAILLSILTGIIALVIILTILAALLGK